MKLSYLSIKIDSVSNLDIITDGFSFKCLVNLLGSGLSINELGLDPAEEKSESEDEFRCLFFFPPTVLPSS